MASFPVLWSSLWLFPGPSPACPHLFCIVRNKIDHIIPGVAWAALNRVGKWLLSLCWWCPCWWDRVFHWISLPQKPMFTHIELLVHWDLQVPFHRAASHMGRSQTVVDSWIMFSQVQDPLSLLNFTGFLLSQPSSPAYPGLLAAWLSQPKCSVQYHQQTVSLETFNGSVKMVEKFVRVLLYSYYYLLIHKGRFGRSILVSRSSGIASSKQIGSYWFILSLVLNTESLPKSIRKNNFWIKLTISNVLNHHLFCHFICKANQVLSPTAR